jgi:hypothetical protein
MSQDATAVAETWRAGHRRHLNALKTDKQFRDDINKVLAADRQGITAARASLAKIDNFDQQDKSEQERQMTEAVLLCVQKRIDTQRYVSCRYPAFKNFIPQLAFGIKGGTDQMRKDCMTRQLAALRNESGRGYASSDDEDEPPKHGDIKEETSGTPPYVGPPRNHKDEKPSKGDDKAATKNQQSHHKRTAAISLKRKRANNNKG